MAHAPFLSKQFSSRQGASMRKLHRQYLFIEALYHTAYRTLHIPKHAKLSSRKKLCFDMLRYADLLESFEFSFPRPYLVLKVAVLRYANSQTESPKKNQKQQNRGYEKKGIQNQSIQKKSDPKRSLMPKACSKRSQNIGSRKNQGIQKWFEKRSECTAANEEETEKESVPVCDMRDGIHAFLLFALAGR